jgi:VWFA-related protein
MIYPQRFFRRAFLVPAVAAVLFTGFAFRYYAAPGEADKGTSDVQKGVFTISDNVTLVLLDVSVRSPKGGYVSGLQKANFQVFEDGRPRQITQFGNLDTPVSIGLVVDNSGSMRRKKPEVTMAGLSFAKQSNPLDEFFVVNFNNSVIRGLPPNLLFTDKLPLIRAALNYSDPAGQTALYDAIAYSLRHLEYAHLDKRTLIVVSDGGDNTSKTTFAELMKMVEASRASIYTVGLFDPDDHEVNPGVLRKIAAVSGGEFFQPETLDKVLPTFEKIAKDIRNTYTVGYIPDESDHHVLRSVKVMAKENNLRLNVHTRTSYVTTPLSELLAQQDEKHKSEMTR